MAWPGWRAWVFSIKAFIAMALAVYVALALDLERPYWAMATVYIVAQPLSGMVQSKAIYRVMGTIAGGSFAVFAVVTFITAPVLLTLALGLWAALCLYLSLMDKTPRAYAFMLAGYTAAFIAFPTVTTPEQIFDHALARSEEIILAILCATLVDMLILPQRVGPVLQRRLESWFKDARGWTASILRGETSPDGARNQLIADATGIEQLRVHATYDTPTVRRAQSWLLRLEQRMQSLFAVLTSIEDRFTQLRRTRPDLMDELQPMIEAVIGWLEQPDPARVGEVHELIASFEPSPSAMRRDMNELLLKNALLRLHDLVNFWADCQAFYKNLVAGVPAPEGATPVSAHRDYPMALLSALTAALAVGISSTFWIASGWPDGSSAPMMAAVMCSFFAASDDPSPLISAFTKTAFAATVIGGIYLFAIFPAIDGYPMLIASMAPFLIVIGTLIANPATMLVGLGTAVNTLANMGLQETYTADIGGYINSSIALILGCVTAYVVTQLVRSVGADFMTRRILRAIRRNLGDIAIGRLTISPERLEGRMVDRISALIPRLRSADEEERYRVIRRALADFRLGYNLLLLRRLRKQLDQETRVMLASFLRRLPDFLELRERPAGQAMPDLLEALDEVLAKVAAAPQSALTDDVLMALIGTRRSLFPEAGAPSGEDGGPEGHGQEPEPARLGMAA